MVGNICLNPLILTEPLECFTGFLADVPITRSFGHTKIIVNHELCFYVVANYLLKIACAAVSAFARTFLHGSTPCMTFSWSHLGPVWSTAHYLLLFPQFHEIFLCLVRRPCEWLIVFTDTGKHIDLLFNGPNLVPRDLPWRECQTLLLFSLRVYF